MLLIAYIRKRVIIKFCSDVAQSKSLAMEPPDQDLILGKDWGAFLCHIFGSNVASYLNDKLVLCQ